MEPEKSMAYNGLLIKVVLHKRCMGYQAGDIAGLKPDTAKQIISSGLGHLLTEDEWQKKEEEANEKMKAEKMLKKEIEQKAIDEIAEIQKNKSVVNNMVTKSKENKAGKKINTKKK